MLINPGFKKVKFPHLELTFFKQAFLAQAQCYWKLPIKSNNVGNTRFLAGRKFKWSFVSPEKFSPSVFLHICNVHTTHFSLSKSEINAQDMANFIHYMYLPTSRRIIIIIEKSTVINSKMPDNYYFPILQFKVAEEAAGVSTVW